MTGKVAITGVGGFIGSRFAALYGDRLPLLPLSSARGGHAPANYALDDYPSIERALRGVEVMVHCAFDHEFRVNRAGIRNILRACEANRVRRLIHLSTVSVYDPFLEGVLTENSRYSTFNDSYSREKIAIENMIASFDACFEIVILQPTVVYGLGGNWTRAFFKAFPYEGIKLPEGGQCRCNAVYVDDVAAVMHKACHQALPDKRVRCLISGREPVSWFDMYDQHSRLLGELCALSHRPAILPASEREFHDNVLVDFSLALGYKTGFGYLLNPAILALRRCRVRLRGPTTSSCVGAVAKEDLIRKTKSLSWTSRLVHRARFSVDISRACSVFGFEPEHSLTRGMAALGEKLREQLGRVRVSF